MTDPVLTFVLIGGSFVALLAVRFFKTLESAVWEVWATPVIAGLICGAILRFTSDAPWLIGILLTLAALYVRLTGHESEPVDGMLLGAASAVAATIPLILDSERPCLIFSECLVAGAVSGFGTTYAAFQVTDKTRRALIDVVTAIAAIGLAYGAWFAGYDRIIAIVVASVIPMIAIVAVFQQWADVRAELGHEASLGFIKNTDVRRTAHPLLRLGSGGWADRKAHREFVRLANKIALRKRQQRNRPDDIARLYQVEIIKLRMQIQEMSKIDRDVVSATQSSEIPSDTMAQSK